MKSNLSGKHKLSIAVLKSIPRYAMLLDPEKFRKHCIAMIARHEENKRRHEENKFNDAFFNNPIPIELREKYSVLQLKLEL